MDVYYIRQKDMGLYSPGSTNKKSEDLKKRCEIIEDIDPDITISIHQNSYQESYVKGAQVFYYSQSVQGKALAEALQENLRKYADRENTRKAKANDSYYILKNTVSPTVIVECGFLSNPKEAEKLQESSYQEKLAEAIYHGICDFLEENSGEDSGRPQVVKMEKKCYNVPMDTKYYRLTNQSSDKEIYQEAGRIIRAGGLVAFHRDGLRAGRRRGKSPGIQEDL